LALKLKLLLYVKLYELYRRRIDRAIELKAFLAIEVPEIFCNFMFHVPDHDQSYKNIEFLLTEVAAVWDPINSELDEQILR
jgi:hypothetical protein